MQSPVRAVRLGALLAMAFVVAAQAATPPPDCSAAEHRQFDFWIGEWEVLGGPQLDRVVGRNSIARVAGGCAISEHWVNTAGKDGRSLNAYDRISGKWQQFWMGSDGVLLHTQGGLIDGAMVLTGEVPTERGRQRQRITWTPQDDGRVTQHWQTSDDAGATWATSFVGIYRKPAAATD